MLFDNTAYSAETAPLFRRFLEIAPWPLWESRFETFKGWCSKNELISEFILERYPLEMQMMLIHEPYQKNGTLPSPAEDASAYRFFSFVSVVARVHQRLTSKGRKNLEGAFRGRLKDNAGLSVLAFEMSTATNLMHKGFDVTFHDYENGGGFDILAERDGAIIEIECKHISADIGRKIHRRRHYEFGGVICREMFNVIDRNGKGVLLRLTLPDRLTGQAAQTNALAQVVKSSLDSGDDFSGPEPCSVEIKEFEFLDSPLNVSPEIGVDSRSLKKFVEERFNLPNSNVLVFGRQNCGAIILVTESRKPDHVLEGIFNQLKDASRDQLTGSRPGVLCVRLSDLTQEQLIGLGRSESGDTSKPTGIQRASSKLLERRPHVHTLSYSTYGEIILRQVRSGHSIETSYQEHGSTYIFRNPNHPQYSDPRYISF